MMVIRGADSPFRQTCKETSGLCRSLRMPIRAILLILLCASAHQESGNNMSRKWPFRSVHGARTAILVVLFMGLAPRGSGQDSPPRCQVIPTEHRSYEFRVDGQARAAWCFPADAPRPFLFPLIGPSGQSVTRMGHPGAPDHDHHRSVWFAHFKVDGFDFWSENGGTAIRQQQWLALEDGDQAARAAVDLQWFDPEDHQLIQQQVIFELRPLANEELALEIQTTLAPAAGKPVVTLQQTNFGILAVRVAKSISQAFGRGVLTSQGGETGEPALFGKHHGWIDYSGSNPVFNVEGRGWLDEGITYFDHPSNHGFPNAWHVRQDGWMCASPTMEQDIVLTADQTLTLRYLLHVHAGKLDVGVASQIGQAFAASKSLVVKKSARPHLRYEIVRNE
jgi:hypothetical protein